MSSVYQCVSDLDRLLFRASCTRTCQLSTTLLVNSQSAIYQCTLHTVNYEYILKIICQLRLQSTDTENLAITKKCGMLLVTYKCYYHQMTICTIAIPMWQCNCTHCFYIVPSKCSPCFQSWFRMSLSRYSRPSQRLYIKCYCEWLHMLQLHKYWL